MPWGDEPLTGKLVIRRLFQEGHVYHGRDLLLITRHVEEGSRRVLFVASRRTGKAVRRNRAKRLMRAAYQDLVAQVRDVPVHLALIARSRCAERGMQDVRAELRHLLGRARLLATPTAPSERRCRR